MKYIKILISIMMLSFIAAVASEQLELDDYWAKRQLKDGVDSYVALSGKYKEHGILIPQEITIQYLLDNKLLNDDELEGYYSNICMGRTELSNSKKIDISDCGVKYNVDEFKFFTPLLDNFNLRGEIKNILDECLSYANTTTYFNVDLGLESDQENIKNHIMDWLTGSGSLEQIRSCVDMGFGEEFSKETHPEYFVGSNFPGVTGDSYALYLSGDLKVREEDSITINSDIEFIYNESITYEDFVNFLHDKVAEIARVRFNDVCNGSSEWYCENDALKLASEKHLIVGISGKEDEIYEHAESCLKASKEYKKYPGIVNETGNYILPDGVTFDDIIESHIKLMRLGMGSQFMGSRFELYKNPDRVRYFGSTGGVIQSKLNDDNTILRPSWSLEDYYITKPVPGAEIYMPMGTYNASYRRLSNGECSFDNNNVKIYRRDEAAQQPQKKHLNQVALSKYRFGYNGVRNGLLINADAQEVYRILTSQSIPTNGAHICVPGYWSRIFGEFDSSKNIFPNETNEGPPSFWNGLYSQAGGRETGWISDWSMFERENNEKHNDHYIAGYRVFGGIEGPFIPKNIPSLTFKEIIRSSSCIQRGY